MNLCSFSHLFQMLVRLGIGNLAAVGIYRVGIRSGLIRRWMPKAASYTTPLFSVSALPYDEIFTGNHHLSLAHALVNGRLSYFSRHWQTVGSPPDWFLNPFTGRRLPHPDAHWAALLDFDDAVGDIKCLWEISRFDWALILAQAYRLTGEHRYLALLNDWASDWTANNPLNAGPNWKCGQEAAIRMMQALLAAFVLHQHKTPAPGLQRFVCEHCSRIAPTIRYAMAQDNNHGTSEAAGLYIGGAWLFACVPPEHARNAKQFLRWHQAGKRWLENRVCKLIALDGSFSQYSLNYHRVALDTLNMVEFWRRELQLPEFSDLFYERARAAVNWLYQMIDPQSGEGPNLGANDGARLFALSSTDYRDYRPTAQLGSALFFEEKCYPAGAWDEPLTWLGLDEKPTPNPSQEGNTTHLKIARESCIMRDGGYVLMRFPSSRAVIRVPNFRFRPTHADALHLDLWHKGINLLRDSGSYSYNTEEPWQSYFSSTQAHNTVEFDGHSQMPRLSRFLFGSWLNMESVGELTEEHGWLSWEGSYRDYRGCRHKRSVSSNGQLWKIIDHISGFKTKAVLRWRLPSQYHWTVEGTRCSSEIAALTVDSSVPISRSELVEGWESQHYMEKVSIPVFEVHVEESNTTLITEVQFFT